MDIVFKREDGSCPYYIYKNTKFFIRDKIKGEGYVYYLAEKDLTSKTIQFDTHEKALTYIRSFQDKWAEYIDSIDQKYLYADDRRYYTINKNIITIKNKAIRITADYDKYLECLQDAKEYIRHYIKKFEPEQLKF